jgi:hypothetical protein
MGSNIKKSEEESLIFKGYRNKWRAKNKEKIDKQQKLYMEKNKEKLKEYYHQYYLDHKDKIRECSKKHYEKNIENRKEQLKKYYEENKDKYRESNRKWKENNPEKYREYYKQYEKRGNRKEYRKEYTSRPETKKLMRRYWMKYDKKRREDPVFTFNQNMSRSIRFSLRKNNLSKNGKHWEYLVGYTCQDLIEHLEKLFKPGMSWDNYGKWHIDHIIPISFFKFETIGDVEFKMCWRLENLQPLWAKENILKSDKILGGIM